MPKRIEGVGMLFTVKEIAEKLGVSETTILRHYRAGKLRGRKVGKSVLFLEESLKEYLKGDDKSLKNGSEGPVLLPDFGEADKVDKQKLEKVEYNKKMAAEALNITYAILRKEIQLLGNDSPSKESDILKKTDK